MKRILFIFIICFSSIGFAEQNVSEKQVKHVEELIYGVMNILPKSQVRAIATNVWGREEGLYYNPCIPEASYNILYGTSEYNSLKNFSMRYLSNKIIQSRRRYPYPDYVYDYCIENATHVLGTTDPVILGQYIGVLSFFR